MLNERQKRQLEEIRKEFIERHITVQTRGIGAITLAMSNGFASIVHWHGCIIDARQDVKDFRIANASSYITSMLQRAGIYGVAIRSPRDDFDIEFGEFVAKARLLKYIKKMEE